MAAGMDDFLVKPIESGLFYRTLARWIGGRDGASAAEHAVLGGEAAERSAEESGATISLAVLAALVDDDPDTMSRLLRIFLDNAASTIDELEAALEQHDLARMNALGHRLKSSARAVGAMRLADTCLALEQMGSVDCAPELVHSLAPMLVSLRRELAGNQRLDLDHARAVPH